MGDMKMLRDEHREVKDHMVHDSQEMIRTLDFILNFIGSQTRGRGCLSWENNHNLIYIFSIMSGCNKKKGL